MALSYEDGPRGHFAMEPIFSTVALDCGSSLPIPEEGAFTVLPGERAISLLSVPVSEAIAETRIHQIVRADWGQRRIGNRRKQAPAWAFCPLIVSAGNSWRKQDSQLNMYDNAVLLDGASRLFDIERKYPDQEVSVIVLFGLTSDREIELRSEVFASGDDGSAPSVEPQIDTPTKRLTITEDWIALTLLSDPFVVPTSFGYAPAILAKRAAHFEIQHILVSAKSLAVPLEALRARNSGSLIGVTIKVRKSGSEKTAPYQIALSG